MTYSFHIFKVGDEFLHTVIDFRTRITQPAVLEEVRFIELGER
jgi:hypothetical protein